MRASERRRPAVRSCGPRLAIAPALRQRLAEDEQHYHGHYRWIGEPRHSLGGRNPDRRAAARPARGSQSCRRENALRQNQPTSTRGSASTAAHPLAGHLTIVAPHRFFRIGIALLDSAHHGGRVLAARISRFHSSNYAVDPAAVTITTGRKLAEFVHVDRDGVEVERVARGCQRRCLTDVRALASRIRRWARTQPRRSRTTA